MVLCQASQMAQVMLLQVLDEDVGKDERLPDAKLSLTQECALFSSDLPSLTWKIIYTMTEQSQVYKMLKKKKELCQAHLQVGF